jgi:hypothetical protein
VAEAGKQIGDSEKFAKITELITGKVQANALTHKRELTTSEIARIHTDTLNQLMSTTEGFRFREELNPVVGGAKGKVTSVAILGRKSQGTSTAVDYKVDIMVSDTYDFQNKRPEGEYTRFREYLARLLQNNDFDAFESAWHDEVVPFRTSKTKLDNAALFACFMYAIEKRGFTPAPLAWEVTVPMYGTLTVPGHQAAAPQPHRP